MATLNMLKSGMGEKPFEPQNVAVSTTGTVAFKAVTLPETQLNSQIALADLNAKQSSFPTKQNGNSGPSVAG